jgi:hypothetical protein
MADYTQDYIADYMDPSQAASPGFDKVIKAALLAFIIFMPVAIIFVVPAEVMATAFLAYINCTIVALVFRHLLLKGTLAAMVPLVFLPYLTSSWSISTLYFAIFAPYHAFYAVDQGQVEISFFDSGVKVQMVVLVFLILYLSVVLTALRKEGSQPENTITNPLIFTYAVTFIGLGIIFFNALSKILLSGGFFKYLAEGLFKYFWGLLFITGAFIKMIPRIVRILIFSLLGCAVLFYTVGNARGMALFTIAMLTFGILFFSEYSKKTKILILLCLLAAFPMYVMISNTTRALTGEIGFKDFFYRLNLLKEWRSAAADKSAVATTLHRLFHSGGHSVITRTPSDRPYHPISPFGFAYEMVASLKPGATSFYTSTGILLDYGFRVIPGQTSVEVSLVAGWWLLGGWPAIIVGGLAMGCFHCWLIKILQRAGRISKMKAFIFFSMYAPELLWATNHQPILYWRTTIYAMFFAFVVYQTLRFTIGDPGRDAPSQDNYVVIEKEDV